MNQPFLNHFNTLKCSYDDCYGFLVIRKQNNDNVYFLGCSKFPLCKKTISIDYSEIVDIGIYSNGTPYRCIDNRCIDRLTHNPTKELLSHIRHLIINRELSEKHISHHNSNLNIIDFNRLNNMLKFDSLSELSEWITSEFENGNIDTRTHSPMGSPYSDFIDRELLPYLENYQSLSDEFQSAFEDK